MTTKPGEVYRVDLGIGGKVRLMVVVSREDANAPRALSVCAPITTKYRGSAYEVELGKLRFLREVSYVNVQGLQAIQHHELSRPLGIVPASQDVSPYSVVPGSDIAPLSEIYQQSGIRP